MKTTELINTGKGYLQSHAPEILAGLGVVGVVGTSVLAAKATPKALTLLEEKEEYKQANYGESLTRFERVLAMAPAYIPATLMGIATCMCILGSNKLHLEREASLTSAYVYLDGLYKEYRRKVEDVCGREMLDRIDDELEKEKILTEEHGSIHEEVLFYDEYSQRYFNMSIFEMMRAIYAANRMYTFQGELSLNGFYEFLNLAPVDIGDKLGWNATKDSVCRGMAWLDISWVKIETPDNLEAFGLIFTVDPSEDWEDWSEFQEY